MIEKPVPADVNAERATLGSILLDRDAIIPTATFLMPDHFHVDKHGVIYAAQLSCYNRRIPPDAVNVADELRRRDQLDAVGGVPYLHELVNSVPTWVHVEYYARIVERTALLRRTITVGGQIAALGFDERDDVDITLSKAQGLLDELRQTRDQGDFYDGVAMADEFMASFDKRQDSDGEYNGVPTGFADLDKRTRGLQRGEMTILAARPRVGKTSLALAIADHAAMQGYGVAYFILEMNREQLAARRLALHTGFNVQDLLTRRLAEDDYQQVVKTIGEISGSPLHVCAKRGITADMIAAKTKALAAQHQIDLVVIDYVQLVKSTNAKADEYQQVTEASQKIMTMAGDLNIPTLALSQLSRALESRTDKVPQLSDLRGAGSLEQDAANVWFIYREELHDPTTDKKGIAELHLAKHRNGPEGIVPLRFFKQSARFASLETYRAPEDYYNVE